MSILNSTTGEVLRNYNVEELKEQANLMRGYNLAALCAATSGHAGGTLSIMDITAALYLRVADHDPKNPNWPDRDRIKRPSELSIMERHSIDNCRPCQGSLKVR